MSNFDKVKDFHEAFGVATRNEFDNNDELIDLRLSLIDEEYEELTNEFHSIYLPGKGWFYDGGNIDKKRVAKELADLLYVVYGFAATFGIDVDRVFNEVHKSNMSKLDEDGKPVYREDGKILKGPLYKEPDLNFIE